jgi:hypothetical protein
MLKSSRAPIAAFDRRRGTFLYSSGIKVSWGRMGRNASTPERQMPTTFFYFVTSVMGIER